MGQPRENWEIIGKTRGKNHMEVSWNGDISIAGWFMIENPMKIRMITRGTPFMETSRKGEIWEVKKNVNCPNAFLFFGRTNCEFL